MPYDDPYGTLTVGPPTEASNGPASPLPKRRRIDLIHKCLASLMSNTDFVAANYVTYLGEPRTARTVFDDFEPAFLIVEYLATPNAIAAFV